MVATAQHVSTSVLERQDKRTIKDRDRLHRERFLTWSSQISKAYTREKAIALLRLAWASSLALVSGLPYPLIVAV